MSIQNGFQIGSWVVYPAHGVGKLDGVDKFEIAGENVKFFVISFPSNKLVLKLPVEKAIECGLRCVASREQLAVVFKILSTKLQKKRVVWSKRLQEYTAKINSGSLAMIAEVIRDVYKDGGVQSLSFSERQVYYNALDRLVKEISIIENEEEQFIVNKVERCLAA